MPVPCLFSSSLYLVVPSRGCLLTIDARAAAAALYLHHTHSRFYSRTTSSRSQTQTNQHRQLKEQRLGKKLDDDYYALLLSSPLPTRTAAAASPPPTLPLSTTDTSTKHPSSSTPKPEPRIIFGSRLAGPAARQKEGWAQERPQEPDNCCMSGCVNCVWDAYREEVEEWAARRRKSEMEERRAVQVGVEQQVEGSTGEVDGPEGGIELEAGALFEGVPVGIKEFMTLEKRLREQERERDKRDKSEKGGGTAMP